MTIGENDKWVIMEVAEVEGSLQLFVAPETLKIEPDYVGNIHWYVFTAGWELAENGIVFPGTSFNGQPEPDPNRPAVWSTATANTGAGNFPYTVNVVNELLGITVTFDPVVQNEAPPNQNFAAHAKKPSRSATARAAVQS